MKLLYVVVALMLVFATGISAKVVATNVLSGVADIQQGSTDDVICEITITGTGPTIATYVSLQAWNGTAWTILNGTAGDTPNITYNNFYGANTRIADTSTITYDFRLNGAIVSVNNKIRCSGYADGQSPAILSSEGTIAVTSAPSDTTAPNIASFKVNKTTGSAYSPTQRYQFNATITDATAVDKVFIEHNFTGTKTNYSVTTKNGNEYYYNYVTLGAGSYSYKWYANDTLGNMNNTDTLKSYAVIKATLPITLYINGTNGDRTLYNDSDANFTANFSAGYSYQISLWTNLTGTLVLEDTESSPLTDIRDLRPYRARAGYTIIANWTGNSNYTLSEASHTLNLNEYVPPVESIDYYGGNDPITIMIDDQVEPSATPTIYALLRNSSGSQVGGQPVNIAVYDKNRNLRSSGSMSEWIQGIYYYESLTLSANDNGTFIVRINTTTAGLNVTSIKTFFVRSFAVGGSGGGLDANQNSTLYEIRGYAEQTNRTINESISPALDSIITSLETIVSDIWSYGTRTLTSFGSLASDVWSVGTRTLSDVSNMWSYATRTLTEFDFKVETSGGNITNVTSPVYCANCSVITTEDIWEYAPRNLTYYESGEGSNLTAEAVWTYETRELTQEISCENVTASGFDSYYCSVINSKNDLICSARE